MTKARSVLNALLLAATLCAGLSHVAAAQQRGQTPSGATTAEFYIRSRDGWFFYEPLPALPEEPPPEEMPPPQLPPKEEAKAAAPAEPPPLSAQWIKAKLPEYLDRAIDAPTQDNVRAFMTVQRVMMDKASQFSEAVQRVTMGDPLLDESARRPMAPFATAALNTQSFKAKGQQLSALSGQAAIWFFYRSDCAYCHQMIPILKNMERLHGFYVMAIALDNLPLGDDFPDWRPDAGQAAQLNVMQTPAVFLVKPPDMFVPLTQGAVTQEDLEQRILLGAVRAGWLSEEDFAGTRNLNASVPSLASVPLDGFKDGGDPNAIVDYIRSRVKER